MKDTTDTETIDLEEWINQNKQPEIMDANTGIIYKENETLPENIKPILKD